MAFKLHPETEIVHEGVRVTVRGVDLPRRGGGTHRREVVEAADAVVVLPLISPEEARAVGVELPGAEEELPGAAGGLPGVAGGLPGAEGGLPGVGVVLIRNERFAVRETLWELPAGTVEAGESPDDCAPRELTEETGYRAARVEKLTAFFPTPGFCTELLHAYRAEGLTQVGQALDETERITAHVVPWGEALAMVRDGTIRDAKTVATLLFHETFGRAGAESKE
ncbi:MAG: NUDIX hydrolase [Planctomycetota bacterium]